MRNLLGVGVVGAAAFVLGAGAQDMPQRGEMAFGRQPMVRGTVTAVAADRVTIKTDAGETYVVALSANTKIVKEVAHRLPRGATDQNGRCTYLTLLSVALLARRCNR